MEQSFPGFLAHFHDGAGDPGKPQNTPESPTEVATRMATDSARGATQAQPLLPADAAGCPVARWNWAVRPTASQQERFTGSWSRRESHRGLTAPPEALERATGAYADASPVNQLAVGGPPPHFIGMSARTPHSAHGVLCDAGGSAGSGRLGGCGRPPASDRSGPLHLRAHGPARLARGSGRRDQSRLCRPYALKPLIK